MSDAVEKQSFAGWAILELMGHRRLGGYVQQEELFGSPMCRIDVPAVGTHLASTHFFGGQSIYCLTPTDEETARRVAAGYHPEPVSEWQLPKPETARRDRVREIAARDDPDSYDPDSEDIEF